MRRLGVIGAGGIAVTLLATLAAHLPEPLDHLSLLVRPGSRDAGLRLLAAHGARIAARTALHDTADTFLADAPDTVAECAGHGAVREHGAHVLAQGCDLIVISIGALADDALRAALTGAARAGGGRLILAAGAIGGIDALAAARLGGDTVATYTGRKPPRAWRGTQAEHLLDLDALTAPVTFYEGSARAAARDYPQNANVAATVAFASAGLDATRVRLIADPGIDRNIHEVSVQSSLGEMSLRLAVQPAAANPKTSLLAGYGLARAVLNRVLPVVI